MKRLLLILLFCFYPFFVFAEETPLSPEKTQNEIFIPPVLDDQIASHLKGISSPKIKKAITQEVLKLASEAVRIDELASTSVASATPISSESKNYWKSLETKLIFGSELAENKADEKNASKSVTLEGMIIPEENPLTRRGVSFRRWAVETKDGNRFPLSSNIALLTALKQPELLDGPVQITGTWIPSGENKNLKYFRTEKIRALDVVDEQPLEGTNASGAMNASDSMNASGTINASETLNASGTINTSEIMNASGSSNASESFLPKSASSETGAKTEKIGVSPSGTSIDSESKIAPSDLLSKKKESKKTVSAKKTTPKETKLEPSKENNQPETIQTKGEIVK
ncbi:MAG: hypothetical protein HQM08_17725 [Candidatus Riflebacteria bacterium]|nr:hypothetical protein [Candidatus Riflebacteria bacterium]